MSDLSKVNGKLGSMIRLLASDTPGEVFSAAQAIGRTLRGVGADFHVLADQLAARPAAKLSDAEMSKLYDAGYKAGREVGLKEAAAQARSGFHNVTASGPPLWEGVVEYCNDRRSSLRTREAEFIDSMLEWIEHSVPTEKQQNWLRAIYVRLGGRLIF